MEAPILVRLSAGVPHARPILNEATVGRERLRLLTWIVSVATVFFVLWSLWLYGVAGDAAARWPDWVVELLGLITGAGLMTLIVLWSLVLWQRRRIALLRAGPRMTIEQLYALSPSAFEHFVAELFERRGYTVEVRGRAGDLGVDLVVRGPDSRLAIVQCKRYRHQIGPDIVRELFGTMVHERAIHGFLVTTAGISEAARQWAANKPITLIDGQTLSQLSDDLRA